MDHQIKELAEAITHSHTKNLVQSHVKRLHFENNHLIIYVDNAGPLQELEEKECDKHLQAGMEAIYGDITYELRLFERGGMHEREKTVPHDINQ